MNEQDNTQQRLGFVQQLNEAGMIIEGVEVKNNKDGFEKLALTPEQKIQISGLLQHMPALTAAGKMAGAYTVKFPKNLPHTLMALKQGGFGSPIISKEGIIGMASFTPMLGQAVAMGVFTALSIATSQYFLKQIYKELNKIDQKIDDILQFLYGDKKAELLAELRFVRYAYDNYVSIMRCEEQRIATLSSIQNARKIAMKDIEFYADDLKRKVNENAKANFNELMSISEKQIIPIERSFDYSLQLYLMSSLMEVFYAQNFAKDYLDYLKEDQDGYVKPLKESMVEDYTTWIGYFNRTKVQAKQQGGFNECQKKLTEHRDKLKEECDGRIKRVNDTLTKVLNKTEYYLEVEGAEYNLYYKNA